MKNDMPVGIPFLLKRKPDGTYSHKLATSRKDFSYESLDYFNFAASKFENRENASPFRCILNGEKQVIVNGKKYRVDGYAKLGAEEYFFEFFGCR